MRVVRRDHLTVFTALEDKAEEVVALATSDHLLANIDDWQGRALVLDEGSFISLVCIRHDYGRRGLAGSYSGGQGSKGQQEITLFHLNIPMSYMVMSALYRRNIV